VAAPVTRLAMDPVTAAVTAAVVRDAVMVTTITVTEVMTEAAVVEMTVAMVDVDMGITMAVVAHPREYGWTPYGRFC